MKEERFIIQRPKSFSFPERINFKAYWHTIFIPMLVLILTSISGYLSDYGLTVPVSFWGQKDVFIPFLIVVFFISFSLFYPFILLGLFLHHIWMSLLCPFQRSFYYQKRLGVEFSPWKELRFFIKRFCLLFIIHLLCSLLFAGVSFLVKMGIDIFLSVIFIVFVNILSLSETIQKLRHIKLWLTLITRFSHQIFSMTSILFLTDMVLGLLIKSGKNFSLLFLSESSKITISMIEIITLTVIILGAWIVSYIVRGIKFIPGWLFSFIFTFFALLIGLSPIGAFIGKSGLFFLRVGGEIPVEIQPMRGENICGRLNGKDSSSCSAHLILETEKFLFLGQENGTGWIRVLSTDVRLIRRDF